MSSGKNVGDQDHEREPPAALGDANTELGRNHNKNKNHLPEQEIPEFLLLDISMIKTTNTNP